MKQQVYWGDMHLNLHHHHIERIEEVFAAASAGLDFLPIAYYPYDYHRIPGRIGVESIGLPDQGLADWETVRDAVARHHRPGEFVTFPGYEWHGNRRAGGDHNVFYREDGPLALPDTLPELYEHCRRAHAIAVPHHTAYLAGAGGRGKNWDTHDDELSPVAEIYSSHGCSEAVEAPIGMMRNLSMGPRVSGGTIQEGLARGLRLGIIASGDTHTACPGVWDHGLVAAWAEELTREAIWDALQERRVYGVTGDRMIVDFTIGDTPMGAVASSSGDLRINASVVCEAALDRIEVLRNNRLVHTHCHTGAWDPRPDGEGIHAKLRIAFGWGPGPQYGMNLGERSWTGRLRIDGGAILGVNGCFTRLGQHHSRAADNEWRWELTTSDRRFPEENIQAIVFELTGASDSQILVETGAAAERFSLAEALAASRVIPLLEETREALWDQFRQRPEELASPDVLYHNSPKVKIHRAVPEVGYTAAISFSDDPPRDDSFYYLRVTQTNGQMAWTSPIWVKR